MDLKAIANTLVDACRNGEEADLLANHYHPNVVSVESADYSGMGRETQGVDGIRGKHAWWAENFEVHGAEVGGPFLHGDDKFAVTFTMDATHKLSGERTAMQEVAIYTVTDGKIVREEFFGTG